MPDTAAEPIEPTPADSPPQTQESVVRDFAVGIAHLPLILNPEGTHIALVRLDRFIPMRTLGQKVIKQTKGLLNAEGRTELKVLFWPRTNAKGFLITGTCLISLVKEDQPSNQAVVLGTVEKVKPETEESKGYLLVKVTPTIRKVQPFVVTFRTSGELLEGLAKGQRVKVTGEVDEKIRLKAKGVEVLENPPKE